MGVHNIITGITPIKAGHLEQLRAVLADLSRPGEDSPIAKISTIHFARWVIIDDGTRLLFTTNFDGSWDDYLDEFIREGHEGLDAIWNNCEGYPEGGARDREAFKKYVRDHEYSAELFYAAYPDATVRNVYKALRIREKFEAFLDEFQ
jgi:hypothetical protein